MRIRTTLLGFVLANTLVFAQGMGGGNGSGNNQGNSYMQMFQSMSGMGAMGGGMGMGMTDDLAVDPDGTAYVVRAVAATPSSTSAAAWQYELAAINPANGGVKWKLQIPGGRISSPRIAPDGRIFVTVDNYQMFYANYTTGGMMMNTSTAQANDGQLVIITHTATSASIQATIRTSSDVLGAPRIVTDASTGAYFVYVLGYDMMSWSTSASSSTGTFAPGNKVLYAYQPDGSLKFTVQLGQATMMP